MEAWHSGVFVFQCVALGEARESERERKNTDSSESKIKQS